MPRKLWWRLASKPAIVNEVTGKDTFTGPWILVSGLQPDTDYETSTVSSTGPWTKVRTKPADTVPADRIPVIKQTHGGRPNWIPADYYKAGQAEFLDPVAHPHIMGVTTRTVKSGRYTDPTVWSTGKVPGKGDVVAVSQGHVLIGDKNDDVILKDMLVEFGGTFRLATDTDTRWRLDTFMAMGNLILVDKTPSATPGKVKHQFIWHIQQAPGASTRGGLMAMGPTRIHGAQKKSHLRIGLSSEQIAKGETVPAVRAGATKAYMPGLAQSGWRVGQYMMFGGTEYVPLASTDPDYKGPTTYYNPGRNTTRTLNRYQFGQEEERIITKIDGDWAHFAEPLIYDHVGMEGMLPQGQHVVNAPVVGNPSHNIELRSASAEEDGHLDPTADLVNLQKRGHSMFMRSPDVDVRYFSTKNMARTDTNPTLWVDEYPSDAIAVTGGVQPLLSAKTGGVAIADPLNVRGRYSIHFHWCQGPYLASAQINCIGASAWAPLNAPPVPGWAITQHGTRMAIEDCFAFNVRGVGMVSELGNEIGHWAQNLSMFCRGDGESSDWGQRQEMHANHNDSAGIGFGNQSRMILMHGNISVSCRYGYLYHAQKSHWQKRWLRDIDMRFKDGLIKGTNGSGQKSYDEYLAHFRAQIPPFLDNEAHACTVGFEVVHRLSSTNWARDLTPMLMERFHCLNVPSPWVVGQYSNSYYVKDCLWKSPKKGKGYTAASLGNVTFGWNFANLRLIDYDTQFADVGGGLNYDGFFIDIGVDGGGAFTNAPVTKRTGITLESKWGVMGDAEKISNDSGIARRYKPITAADLPQPYPLAPYGYGGVLPKGYAQVPVGKAPYFILGNGVDMTGVNTTLAAGAGRSAGSVHGIIVDSVGVRRWPDAQSSESSLSNVSVKGPINLDKLQPEQLVQRWGCWKDNGVVKSRAWFPIADRYTHVRSHFHIDFTITGLSADFIAAHDIGGAGNAPDWPDKLEAVTAQQAPLMPVSRSLRFLSRTRLEAVAGHTLAHNLLADEVNARFTISGGADAALFRISGRQLQWADNGARAIGSDNTYDVTLRVMDTWGNYQDEPHQVVVIPGERVTTEIVDTFDRADELLRVKHPKAVALAGNLDVWAIRANKLAYLGGAGVPHLVSLGSLGSSDQEIIVSYQASQGAATAFRVVDAKNYLSARRLEGGIVSLILSMTVAGVTTEVARFRSPGTVDVRITVEGRKLVVRHNGTSTTEPVVHYPKNAGYQVLSAFESGPHWEPGALLLPANAPMGTEVGFVAVEAGASNPTLDNFTARALNSSVGA
ncbi:hypothetical protein [Falsirhodobacter sp. 1013]|uniref:hypothetical protein n=1 Tax=Falsirhodobacter sp. 1013 TaxID=3417566 RepID=UPI003EBA83B3